MYLIGKEARWGTYHLRHVGRAEDITGAIGSAYTNGREGTTHRKNLICDIPILHPVIMNAIREAVPDNWFILNSMLNQRTMRCVSIASEWHVGSAIHEQCHLS